MDDSQPDIDAALRFLRSGGLAEISSMSMIARHEKYDKILLTTETVVALVMLAEVALNDRKLN
jgi:hypothetical protein